MLDQKWTKRACLQIDFLIWIFNIMDSESYFFICFLHITRTRVSFYDVNITDWSSKFKIYVEFD